MTSHEREVVISYFSPIIDQMKVATQHDQMAEFMVAVMRVMTIGCSTVPQELRSELMAQLQRDVEFEASGFQTFKAMRKASANT